MYHSILKSKKSNRQIYFFTKQSFIKKIVICVLFSFLSNPVFSEKKKVPDMVVTDNTGTHFAGRLLCFNDTLMLLWQSESDYHPSFLEHGIKVIPVSAITQVVIVKKGKALKGFIYGLTIGGGCGAYYGIRKSIDDDGLLIGTWNAGNKALEYGLMTGIPAGLVGCIIGAANGVDEKYEFQYGTHGNMIRFKQLKKYAMFNEHIPHELNEYWIDH